MIDLLFKVVDILLLLLYMIIFIIIYLYSLYKNNRSNVVSYYLYLKCALQGEEEI